jgi:glycosyltransferase involved in cell wall biosynthesis
MRVIVALGIAAAAAPAALAALHLTALAGASLLHRAPRRDLAGEGVALLVLIPAHNEERVIGETLAALMPQQRSGDHVIVAADRCTDGTATLARAFGATVLERAPESPPGRAATVEHGLSFAAPLAWDGVVVIDADSVVEPGFLDAIRAGLAAGAPALQARSESIPERGVIANLALAAYTLRGVLVPRGRHVLGVCVRMQGSGMALRRDVLARHRFRARGASEDLWLSMDLLLDGVLPRFADGARLRSQSARSLRAASRQRLRWESGRILAAQEFLVPLLRRRDRACLEAALHLLTPPVAVSGLLLGMAAALEWWAGFPWVALVAAGLLAALAVDVAVALAEARAPLRTWLSLLSAPLYVAWKAAIQVWALFSLRQARVPYAPTPRA